MIIIRFNLFNKVIEVVRVYWVDLVHKDSQDSKDLLVLKVILDSKVGKDIQVSKDSQDSKDIQDFKDILDFKVGKVIQVSKDSRDILGSKEI